MNAFNLLKNKELDKTTTAVLCLIFKLFLRLDNLGVKGRDWTKTEIFVRR
jgi:hypothetical protein